MAEQKKIAFLVASEGIEQVELTDPWTHVEKAGHWINVDGQRGVLTVAVSAPAGVRRLDATLAHLAQLVAPAAAPTSAKA